MKIKESFTTTEDAAKMKLIAHIEQCYPTELICVEAKRLRGARFKAYHQLLEELETKAFDVTPKLKVAKKGTPMRPLSDF